MASGILILAIAYLEMHNGGLEDQICHSTILLIHSLSHLIKFNFFFLALGIPAGMVYDRHKLVKQCSFEIRDGTVHMDWYFYTYEGLALRSIFD